MKAKDLIKILEKNPDMVVGKYDGIGCFIPLDESHVTTISVMTAKSDATYTCAVNDPVWKDKKKEFNDPFTIIVVGW